MGLRRMGMSVSFRRVMTTTSCNLMPMNLIAHKYEHWVKGPSKRAGAPKVPRCRAIWLSGRVPVGAARKGQFRVKVMDLHKQKKGD